MATIDGNLLFHKGSGKIGNFILRQRNGKTVVYSRPVSETNWAPTPRQEKNREKFAKANEYSKKVLTDVQLRDFYSGFLKKKHLTIQTVAVRDFRKPPIVKGIEVRYKQNQAIIRVEAHDDTKVTGVEVTLIDRYGQVITSGQAQYAEYWYWDFNAGELPQIPGGYRVEAIASDMPGNTGTLTTLLEEK